jgi:hypothetical protein
MAEGVGNAPSVGTRPQRLAPILFSRQVQPASARAEAPACLPTWRFRQDWLPSPASQLPNSKHSLRELQSPASPDLEDRDSID